VNIAVVNGDIPAGEAYDLLLATADCGRFLRLPSSPEDLRRLSSAAVLLPAPAGS
jgi:hypothetical protein